MSKLAELQLKEADKLCAKCMLGSKMLCPGIRPYPTDSGGVAQGVCQKLASKREGEARDVMRKHTWIPDALYNKLEDVDVKFDDLPLVELLRRDTHVAGLAVVKSLAKQMVFARYLYAYAFLRAWDGTHSDMMTQIMAPDFLFVDRIDNRVTDNARREVLIESVRARVMSGKKTLVTVSASWEPNMVLEGALVELIEVLGG